MGIADGGGPAMLSQWRREVGQFESGKLARHPAAASLRLSILPIKGVHNGIESHLTFNGQCEAAFRFYEKYLGGKIVVMMMYGDSPVAEQTPLAWRKKVIHATLALGDHRLTGGDVLPESYQKPQGFSVFLNIGAAVEAERIFNSLAQNGTVQVPLQETFWALLFGMLVDQFGTPWLINCGKPT